MGYKTPNIDRIANEGMTFTDHYGEQSCTAGHSSFITGQSVFRTGLSKVGLPGAELGMRKEDPTIAGLLKAQGYAMPPASSARTTSAIATSTCRPTTASTNSSAISIT
jgi:arylsulfatase A-like enzyme